MSKKNQIVTLHYIEEHLLQYFEALKDIRKAKDQIDQKYSFETETELWPVDDIYEAWEGIQQMKQRHKRQKWSIVIMLQILKQRQNKSEYDESKMTETQSMPDLATSTSRRHHDSQNKVHISEDTSSIFGCFPHRKKASKGTHTIDKDDLASLKIYIPFSHMGTIEDQHPVQADNSPRLKLIDGVPSFAKTLKSSAVRPSYVLQYDNRTRNAAWVFEILNQETLTRNANPKKGFKQDDEIHEYYRSQSKEEYSNGAFHRGHLAAAANHNWSQKARDGTYLLSNITPQNAKLNLGVWKTLENQCRRYITHQECSNVYVYTGPLYCPKGKSNTFQMEFIEGKAVPTDFFKVIIVEQKDGTRDLECYIIPNTNPTKKIEEYKVPSITIIEKASGLLFSEKCLETESNQVDNVTVQFKAQEKNREISTSKIKADIITGHRKKPTPLIKKYCTI